jgi:hypothetical protein
MTTALTSKPWDAHRATIPAEIHLPQGMLGDEERRALWWLGRHHATGEGAVVDAGAFLGASAFCLASGAAADPVPAKRRRLIHSYDYFSAIDDYVAQFITEKFRPTSAGDSYLDIFEWQTGRYKEYVTAYSGDFLQHKWDGQPIEILFIDIAKTPELNSHLIKNMFSCLIPEKTVVIQQDFYHCWHPHIHISMEYLREYFEMVDGCVLWQSRIYRCTRPIPDAAIAELAAYAFSADEKRALLEAAADRESGDMKAMIETARLWQVLCDGDLDRFAHDEAAFWRRWPRGSGALWARQMGELADHHALASGRAADGAP